MTSVIALWEGGRRREGDRADLASAIARQEGGRKRLSDNLWALSGNQHNLILAYASVQRPHGPCRAYIHPPPYLSTPPRAGWRMLSAGRMLCLKT